MLHSISWFQFGAFLLVGLIIYYGYVFVRYFRQDIRDWRRRGKDNHGRPEGKRLDVIGSPEHDNEGGWKTSEAQLGKNEPGQAGLFPDPPAEEEVLELFKAMEKVIILLSELVKECAITGVKREELEERIRGVLDV